MDQRNTEKRKGTLTFAYSRVIVEDIRVMSLKQVIWGHTDQTWGTQPTPTPPHSATSLALRPTTHLTAVVTTGALDYCTSWDATFDNNI